jgi:hypothetical protein
MACFRLLIALAVAASCSLSDASLEAQTSPLPHKDEAPAAPPPSIHDPVSGPFLAVVDEQGALVDADVITNAIQSWAGARLAAFSLCFQPAAKPINWKVALHALDYVSHELKTRGAEVVVVHAARVCATPPAMSIAGKPHVEILGVIRGRD